MAPSTPPASRTASKYTSPSKKQRLNNSEVESQRYESLDRLKDTWDDIAARYAKTGEDSDEEDDVFDLTNCSIVEDNGWLRGTEALPFGSFTLSESEKEEDEGGTAEQSASEESAEEEEIEIEEPSSNSEAESDHEEASPIRQRSSSRASGTASSSRSTSPVSVQLSTSPKKSNWTISIEPPPLPANYRSQSPFLRSSPPTSQRSTASSLFSYHSSSTAATSPSPGPSQLKPPSTRLRSPGTAQTKPYNATRPAGETSTFPRPSTSKAISSSPSTTSRSLEPVCKSKSKSPGYSESDTRASTSPPPLTTKPERSSPPRSASRLVEQKARTRSTPTLTQRTHNLSIHTPQRQTPSRSSSRAESTKPSLTPRRSESVVVRREQTPAGERRWIISKTPLKQAAKCPGDWSDESNDPLAGSDDEG